MIQALLIVTAKHFLTRSAIISMLEKQQLTFWRMHNYLTKKIVKRHSSFSLKIHRTIEILPMHMTAFLMFIKK